MVLTFPLPRPTKGLTWNDDCLLSQQLPPHIRQNSAVLKVEHLLRRVDSNDRAETSLTAVGRARLYLQFAVALDRGFETDEIVDFLTCQSKAGRAFSRCEL